MDQETRDRLNANPSEHINYYDGRGYPMPMATWAESFEDLTYRRVAYTRLPRKHKWVSTVWLGLDHQYGIGPPLIFESMVFYKDGPYHKWPDLGTGNPSAGTLYKGPDDLDQRRYSTEAEALDGHRQLVKWWRLNRRQRRRVSRKREARLR